eukprot:824113-Pelagomonas_calceolata.AAC.1
MECEWVHCTMKKDSEQFSSAFGTSELSKRTCSLLQLTRVFISLAWFGYRHLFASAKLPLQAGRAM